MDNRFFNEIKQGLLEAIKFERQKINESCPRTLLVSIDSDKYEKLINKLQISKSV